MRVERGRMHPTRRRRQMISPWALDNALLTNAYLGGCRGNSVLRLSKVAPALGRGWLIVGETGRGLDWFGRTGVADSAAALGGDCATA